MSADLCMYLFGALTGIMTFLVTGEPAAAGAVVGFLATLDFMINR